MSVVKKSFCRTLFIKTIRESSLLGPDKVSVVERSFYRTLFIKKIRESSLLGTN